MAAETEATERRAGSRRVDVAAAQRGTVLRLPRGEDLGAVSRSLGVMAATLAGWVVAALVTCAPSAASLSSPAPLIRSLIFKFSNTTTRADKSICRAVRLLARAAPCEPRVRNSRYMHKT